MTEQTLDKKYRPTKFEDFFGNTETIASLRAVIHREQSFPASVLLTGPSGCGKTTLARIIANELGATKRDLKQYNISDMRGIDAARSIIQIATIAPWGQCRVIILNECHKATNEFQNAMLEILEEPPPRNYFILCTTDPTKLLKTIKTRCTLFTVDLLSISILCDLVSMITKEENTDLDPAIITEIAKAADGSPRQALVILDSVIDLQDVAEQKKTIRSYYADEDTVIDLCRALVKKESWKTVANIIKNMDGKEAESIRYAILGYFEKVLFTGGKEADRVSVLMDLFTSSFYNSGRPGLSQACYLAIKT